MRLALVTTNPKLPISKTQLEASLSVYINRVLVSLLSQDDRTSLIEGIRDACWNGRCSKITEKLVFEPIKTHNEPIQQDADDVSEAIEVLTEMSKKRKTTDLANHI